MQGIIIASVLMVASPGESAAHSASATRPRVEGPAPASTLDPYFAAVDRPAAPQWRGRGLLITGGLLGGLGLATNIVRIGMAQGLCKDITYDFKTVHTAGFDSCLNGTGALLMLSPAALALNVTSFGLVAGGSSVHGRWAAYETVHEEARRRRGGVQLGIGAGIMAAAVAGYVVTRVMSFADVFGAETCFAGYPSDPQDEARSNLALAGCVRTRWSGYLAGIAATQSASILGVGLLAHGAGYLRHARLYRKARVQQVRLQPAFSPTWAGVSLTGRF